MTSTPNGRNSDLDQALADARARYMAAHPHSERLHGKARSVLPGGNTRSVLFYAPFPTAMARGSEWPKIPAVYSPQKST